MTTKWISTATAIMAFAFLVTSFGMPSLVAAQACESTCIDACAGVIGAEKRTCMMSCFAGRCENPGAISVGEQLGAMGQPGLSCVADGVCNAFCEEGSTPDPDCDIFPEGHVGFAVEVFLNGVKQFFASDELQTTGEGTATQDASGVLALSVLPCEPQNPVNPVPTVCANLGAVLSLRSGFFAAGTTVNFNVVQVSGLPAARVSTICFLNVIPDSFFSFSISDTSVGEHSFTLVADEPDRIVIFCRVGSGLIF